MPRIVAASLLLVSAALPAPALAAPPVNDQRAEYRGTRLAAPSETGLARVLVASPP